MDTNQDYTDALAFCADISDYLTSTVNRALFSEIGCKSCKKKLTAWMNTPDGFAFYTDFCFGVAMALYNLSQKDWHKTNPVKYEFYEDVYAGTIVLTYQNLIKQGSDYNIESGMIHKVVVERIRGIQSQEESRAHYEMIGAVDEIIFTESMKSGYLPEELFMFALSVFANVNLSGCESDVEIPSSRQDNSQKYLH